MKKYWYAVIVFGFILTLFLAWYLITPAFVVVAVDEASPLDDVQMTDNVVSIDIDEMEEQMEALEDVVVEMDDNMPSSPAILLQADFEPESHEVAGRALVIETEDMLTLRFEDFETINGPELHIYLSSSLEDEDFIDLGIIKATKGNVNYELPMDIDLEHYNTVLVWCEPFSVLFSYAVLE
jgi:hypothetical protein